MSYFAPDQPEYNYLRHLNLIIVETHALPEVETFLPQVAHYAAPDAKYPDDWFFDSFLILQCTATSGNYLYADVNCGTTMCGEGDFHAWLSPNPATVNDWKSTFDLYLGANGIADRLDKAIDEAAKTLGEPPTKRNLVIPIPYPHPTQWAFGRISDDPNAPILNFSCIRQRLDQASAARLAACQWYIDESIKRFKALAPKHLHLLGFYWLYESLHYSWDVDDHWVLKELYPFLHERGMKQFWIPFYSSWNVNMMHVGKNKYWDAAFLQPNHMFYKRLTDVDTAAREAKEAGGGIEMEYATRIKLCDIYNERHERFRNYLNSGVTQGYMTESALAWFHSNNDITWMLNADDPVEREFYQDIYQFVKGNYKIK